MTTDERARVGDKEEEEEEGEGASQMRNSLEGLPAILELDPWHDEHSPRHSWGSSILPLDKFRGQELPLVQRCLYHRSSLWSNCWLSCAVSCSTWEESEEKINMKTELTLETTWQSYNTPPHSWELRKNKHTARYNAQCILNDTVQGPVCRYFKKSEWIIIMSVLFLLSPSWEGALSGLTLIRRPSVLKDQPCLSDSVEWVSISVPISALGSRSQCPQRLHRKVGGMHHAAADQLQTLGQRPLTNIHQSYLLRLCDKVERSLQVLHALHDEARLLVVATQLFFRQHFQQDNQSDAITEIHGEILDHRVLFLQVLVAPIGERLLLNMHPFRLLLSSLPASRHLSVLQNRSAQLRVQSTRELRTAGGWLGCWISRVDYPSTGAIQCSVRLIFHYPCLSKAGDCFCNARALPVNIIEKEFTVWKWEAV